MDMGSRESSSRAMEQQRLQEQQLIITSHFNLPDTFALALLFFFPSKTLQLSRRDHNNN